MVNLSYNLSDKIKANINKIDALLKEVLLTPVNPKNEIRHRWNANINKTYWGLTLAGNPLSKAQMSKLITKPLPKKLRESEKEVVSYYKTLNEIYQNWSASKKLLTTKDVLNIYDFSCKSTFGSTSTYYKSKEDLVGKILNFVELGNEHPIIQSGLLQIEIIKLSPFENGTGRVARLLSHLILAKHGYNLRGLLVLEDYYRNDLISLKEATKSIEKNKNATKWLEYYTDGLKLSMEKVLEILQKPDNQPNNGWKLTDRQKQIVEYLYNPDAKITNRDVCKMYNVSQITASRDLSKIVNLGMILVHGKGRSVYYTS